MATKLRPHIISISIKRASKDQPNHMRLNVRLWPAVYDALGAPRIVSASVEDGKLVLTPSSTDGRIVTRIRGKRGDAGRIRLAMTLSDRERGPFKRSVDYRGDSVVVELPEGIREEVERLLSGGQHG